MLGDARNLFEFGLWNDFDYIGITGLARILVPRSCVRLQLAANFCQRKFMLCACLQEQMLSFPVKIARGGECQAEISKNILKKRDVREIVREQNENEKLKAGVHNVVRLLTEMHKMMQNSIDQKTSWKVWRFFSAVFAFMIPHKDAR
jgi:hypothetical protein